MSRFEFTLAQAQDDGALRARMAQDRMDGMVSVSFRREPSYFIGTQIQGEQAQVIKCVDTHNARLVGLGTRLRLPAFINGQRQELGYLSDLRGDEHYRGGLLLARGYRLLRQLHEQAPLHLYYSLILEGNQKAIDALSGARAGLPCYTDRGRVLTPALHLDLAHRSPREHGLRFAKASTAQLPALIQFLQREYTAKQFAPLYTVADFHNARLRGLHAHDITLALRGNEIVGSLGCWDQRAFRQTHIERYNTSLALTRPLYNLLARFTPLKRLPDPGEMIPYFYLAFCASKDNNPAIFRALLAQVHEERRHGPWHYCIGGLHEDDALAEVFNDYRRIPSAGRLFVIHYPEQEPAFTALDARTPFLEIGAV